MSEADSLKIYKGLQEGPGELLTQVERNSCIILDFAGSKASDRITFNNGNLDQVQSLPSGGSNVNAASPQNNTALVGVTAHSVVGKDDILRKVENPKWIKKLLDGVDVTIAFKNNAARILYQGTLYQAILDDDFRIVEYLVKNSLFFTHSPKDSVHSVFSEGFTPIMLAGGLGQVQTVRTLLDCEANVSKVSDGGDTAFDFALRGQHYGVALMILNDGFTVDDTGCVGWANDEYNRFNLPGEDDLLKSNFQKLITQERESGLYFREVSEAFLWHRVRQ